MKPDFLFKPISNIYLRVTLFVGALILFMWGGLLFARSLSAQDPDDGWQLALAALAGGGLLFFKARTP